MPAGVQGGVRYTVDVGPSTAVEAVGVRVSLRRRLPEGGLGDVLGTVTRWSDGVVEVVRRDGTVVSVDEADVVAAKRVPPAPERRPRG